MQKTWTAALGKLTYGIYALTTFHEKKMNAMIASWVTQISYDPPLIMVAVHPDRYSHRLIEKSGVFNLHILSGDQKDIMSRFKGPDPEAKFSGIQWRPGITGCPILQKCIAYLECRVSDSFRPGNHTLFIGEIVAAEIFSDENVLTTLDYRGQYIGQS